MFGKQLLGSIKARLRLKSKAKQLIGEQSLCERRKVKMPYEQLAQWSFDRPGDNQRYATRHFAISEKDLVRELLPADARNINLIVEHPIDSRRERELNPSAFAERDKSGKLTERGMQEMADIRRQAITQHVHEDADAYDAKLTCLALGKQGSMPLRDLAPLRAAASIWALSASDNQIAECKREAEEIMQAKFAGARSVADLVGALGYKAHQAEPSDYDDSDQAIGKQQLAWNERDEAQRTRSAQEAASKRPAFGEDF